MEKELHRGGHSIRTKRQLLNYLRAKGWIKSGKVAEVMDAIDRALFVREGSLPYIDSHLPNGHGNFICPPNHHAECLELLLNHLKPGMHALDVGSGTGYLTACFAIMVGSNGRAVGVECEPELVDFSVKSIEKSEAAPLLRQGSLSVHVGDGVEGWAACAPYDAIHVGCVVPEIFPALIEQLKPGGRLIIPVEEGASVSVKVIEKKSCGKVTVQDEIPMKIKG